jgi:hypothetical protein
MTKSLLLGSARFTNSVICVEVVKQPTGVRPETLILMMMMMMIRSFWPAWAVGALFRFDVFDDTTKEV